MASSKLLKVFTIIYVFCATEFMGLYGALGIPLYSVTVSHACCFALAIIFAILMIIREDYKILINKKEYYFVFALLLISVIELWTTKKVADSYSIVLIITEAFPYMAVSIEFFVFTKMVKTENDLVWLELVLEKASFILNIMAIVQFIAYPAITFLPINSALFRNGLPRIYVGGEVVTTLGMLISVCAVLQRKHRKISYLNLFAFFVVRLIVTQARSATLVLIAIILIGTVYVSKSLRNMKTLIQLLLGLIVICFLMFGDIQQTSMSLYKNDYSFMVRFDGIAFFWEKFLEYPIWGMGFISLTEDKNSLAYSLLSNDRGYRYNRSDVGFFGFLNMFGIVGAIWFAFLLNDIRKKGKVIFNNSKDIFGTIVFWYLLVTSINLIVTDFQRIGLLPILLLMINKKYEFCRRE